MEPNAMNTVERMLLDQPGLGWHPCERKLDALIIKAADDGNGAELPQEFLREFNKAKKKRPPAEFDTTTCHDDSETTEAESECSLENFAWYFLYTLRRVADIHLTRCNDTEAVTATPSQTPDRSKRLATKAAHASTLNDSLTHDTSLDASFDSTNTIHSTPKRTSISVIEHGKAFKTFSSSTSTPHNRRSHSNNNSNNSGCSSQSRRSNASNSNFTHTPSTPTPAPGMQANAGYWSSNSNTPARAPAVSSSASSFCLADFIVRSAGGAGGSYNRPGHLRKRTPEGNAASPAVNTNIKMISNSRQKPQQTATDTTPTGGGSSAKTRPKKRVVPFTIGKALQAKDSGAQSAFSAAAGFPGHNESPFEGTSSFVNDNNILKVSHIEVAGHSIEEERKALKLNAIEICRELQTSTTNSPASPLKGAKSLAAIMTAPTKSSKGDTQQACDFFDVSRAVGANGPLVTGLARIYSTLIDLNLTANVLNEISFLINILNCYTALSMDRSSLRAESVKGNDDEANDEAHGFDCSRANHNKPSKRKNHKSHLYILSDLKSCVFFALATLEEQRGTLASLDLRSLDVLVNNEALQLLGRELISFLRGVQQQKQMLINLAAQQGQQLSLLHSDNSFRSVYFHEEGDSRRNFTSNNEFGAFKTQRDRFYEALKSWERNHLNPAWNFSIDLTPKIRDIFRQSESWNNMAHLAKLFVSQLLLSSSDTTSPEEIGMELSVEVDPQKFSKLSQRLITPSNFSADYQFPRNQAFFRDFIIEARSGAFVEQLKLALFSELMALNDSPFELLSLSTEDDDKTEADYGKDAPLHDSRTHKSTFAEYLVRPNVMASMLILAKFLGFTSALPFQQGAGNYCSPHTAAMGVVPHAASSFGIEKRQLRLRSLFQQSFDVRSLLQKAYADGKLLVTVPWLVQYMAMLDNLTIQLEQYADAIKQLCLLYAELGQHCTISLSPPAIFILRCCLGWLFDQKPFIYTSCATSVLVSGGHDRQLAMTARRNCASNKEAADKKKVLDAALEVILSVACPFLAEFRVTIMPAKHASTKYVSRTGRYRHITTRYAELNANEGSTSSSSSQAEKALATNAPDALHSECPAALAPAANSKTSEHKLIEAFLHSQNSSMRRLIEFLIERSYKCVVKDAQTNILLPLKNAADQKVNEITSRHSDEIAQSVTTIYGETREQTIKQWHDQIPSMLRERIVKGCDALLPVETHSAIKQAYVWLIKRQAIQRATQWYEMNFINNATFYYADLNELVQKIHKANMQRVEQEAYSSELTIVKAQPSVSDILDELQLWLYRTSPLRAERRRKILSDAEDCSGDELPRCSSESLLKLLATLPASFENTLPTIYYRLVGSGLLNLLQNIIVTAGELMTPAVIQATCDVLSKTDLQKMGTTESAKNSGKSKSEEDELSDGNSDPISTLPGIYESLITVPLIESLGNESARYDKLRQLLVAMIRGHLISIDFVNESFLRVFKADLTAATFNQISRMLQEISEETGASGAPSRVENGKAIRRQRTANTDDTDTDDDINLSSLDDESDDQPVDHRKSHLFMEVLADLTRDIEHF